MSMSPNQILQLMNSGQWQLALQEVNSAIADHPRSAKAFYYRAQIADHLGMKQQGLADLSRAQELNQNVASAQELALIQNHLANLPNTPAPQVKTFATVQQPTVVQHAPKPESSSHIGLWVIGALLVAAVVLWWRSSRRTVVVEPMMGSGPVFSGGYRELSNMPPPAPVASGSPTFYNPPANHTTVVHDHGSGVASGVVGFGAGLLAADLLSHHHGGYNGGYNDRYGSQPSFSDQSSSPSSQAPLAVDAGNSTGNSWDDSSSRSSSSNDSWDSSSSDSGSSWDSSSSDSGSSGGDSW